MTRGYLLSANFVATSGFERLLGVHFSGPRSGAQRSSAFVMASNVSPPWIYEYFLDIAETHGGNLMLVPPSSNSKKVQLIKVRTRSFSSKTSSIDRFASFLPAIMVVFDIPNPREGQLDMGRRVRQDQQGHCQIH